MNKYLERAYLTLPGYQQSLELADQAKAMLAELRPPKPIAPELDPMRTGKVTDEWLDAIDADAAALAQLERRRNVLLTLKRDATAQATSAATLNINALLTHLQTDLTRLLNEAEQVAAQLHGASTAEQAIANDASAAWKRLSQLAGDYQELRAAQAEIMRKAPFDIIAGNRPASGEGEAHASRLYLKNIDSLWPDWSRPNHKRSIHADGRVDRLEPWPPEDDSTGLLLWLVRSPAEGWIPTVTEVHELHSRRIAKANPLPRVVAGTIRTINQPTRVR